MVNIASLPKQSLQKLETRIPPVSDKALIDLVNGIQINGELIQYRKNRGLFGRIFDRLTGNDHQRQLLLDGNLIAGQQALHNWVLELTDSLKVSQLGLQVTQQSLLEARNAIKKNKTTLQNQDEAIISLTQELSQLAQQVNNSADLKQRGYQDAKRCLEPILDTLMMVRQQRQVNNELFNSTQRLLNDAPL